jgi:hypothetical protein
MPDWPAGTVLERTIHFHASGLPMDIDTPVVVVYKDDALTQITAGASLTPNWDGLTGLHHLTVDTTADAAYTAGSFYSVVLTSGTLDGVSIAPYVLDEFTLEVPGGVLALVKARIPDVLSLDNIIGPLVTVVDDVANDAQTFEIDSTLTDGHWVDAWLVGISGAWANQVKRVTAFDDASNLITVHAPYTTGEPSAGDTARLVTR